MAGWRRILVGFLCAAPCCLTELAFEMNNEVVLLCCYLSDCSVSVVFVLHCIGDASFVCFLELTTQLAVISRANLATHIKELQGRCQEITLSKTTMLITLLFEIFSSDWSRWQLSQMKSCFYALKMQTYPLPRRCSACNDFLFLAYLIDNSKLVLKASRLIEKPKPKQLFQWYRESLPGESL